MNALCAWCQTEGRPAFLGEREPFDDPRETHGICPAHRRALLAQLPSSSFPDVALLLVVAPNETGLHAYLQESLVGVSSVQVIIERRRPGERRRESRPVQLQRRKYERRVRRGDMSPLGYTSIRFGPSSTPTR